MNEIGLMGLALLATGSTLLVVGQFVLGLPFAILGAVGLMDNLLLSNRIIRWILKLH